MDPYAPKISINLGDTLPYFYERFLKVLGKDQESVELRAWFEELQRIGLQDASYVQCVGMHTPLPLDEIYRPTRLMWQTGHLIIQSSVTGKRETITLPSHPVS